MKAHRQPTGARGRQEGEDSTRLHGRLDRIYGTWNDVRARRAGSPAIDLESMAGLIGIVSILPLISLDSALLGLPPDEGANWQFRFVDARTAVGLLGACFAFQAWSIDRALGALTAQPWLVRPWVRWLRPLLAGVPIAGLFMIPVWYGLVRQRPTWAFRRGSGSSGRPVEDLRLVGLLEAISRRARPRGFLSLWNQLGLFLLGVLVTMACAEWAWRSESSAQLSLGSIAFHGLGFASVFYFLSRKARRTSTWHGRAVPFLAVFWLVPVPLFALIGILIPVLAGNAASGMAHQTLAPGGEAPQWVALRQRLHRSWQDQPWWRHLLPRRVELGNDTAPTESAAKVMLLARLKSFLLLPEGAIFTQLVIWLEDDLPQIAYVLALALVIGAGMSLFLAAVGLIMTSIRFLQSYFRVHQHCLPYFPYLAAGHLSFLSGFMLAGSLNYGYPAGGLLLVYGICGSVYFGLWATFRDSFLVPKKSAVRFQESLVWLGGMIFIASSGMSLSNIKDEAVVLELVRELVFILTFGGAIGGLILVEWLLRPRSLRDVLDRAMPIADRVKLAVMAATAVLPLGGFLVPVWFYLRRKNLDS